MSAAMPIPTAQPSSRMHRLSNLIMGKRQSVLATKADSFESKEDAYVTDGYSSPPKQASVSLPTISKSKSFTSLFSMGQKNGNNSSGSVPENQRSAKKIPENVPELPKVDKSVVAANSKNAPVEPQKPKPLSAIAERVIKAEAEVASIPPASAPMREIIVTEIDPRDEKTPDAWIPRHSELLRLTGRHPFNCEPPLSLLMEEGWITPPAIHYVRNHGYVPKCDIDTHTITVEGLVKQPRTFTMREIMEFPSATFPVTLVCAGNRRKEQNMIKQTVGFNWGPSGLSNSLWKGVLLTDLINACGGPLYPQNEGEPEPNHVCFDGIENLPNGIYGTSVDLDKALDPKNDILIAYEQNGTPLTPDHGFPVRVIIPGFVGGRMIKWLSKITVSSDQSDSFYHYHDNRVLPPPAESAEIATAEGWWYKPDYIINELNINSATSSPAHEEILTATLTPTSKTPYTFRGYAYTGGGRKIIRMEISFDSGSTWKLATLHPYPVPESEIDGGRGSKKGTYIRHRGTRFWCWWHWSYEVEDIEELLIGSDKNINNPQNWLKEIVVRAWDAGQNTQPEKPTWTLMGMMNNPWFRVRSHIKVHPPSDVSGSPVLEVRFEHPTGAGNGNGGWMRKGEEDKWYDVSQKTKAIESDQSEANEAKPAESTEEQPVSKWISMSEVKKHDNEKDCWIVVNAKVYDCTPFLAEHPGGPESILLTAGTDCTEEFNAIHSQKGQDLLKNYYIGHVKVGEPEDLTSEVETENELAVLDAKKYKPLTLVERINLSKDIRLFRFKLPVSDTLIDGKRQTSGLLPGQHVFLKCTRPSGNGTATAIRAYTPTSIDTVFSSDHGYLDLLIKIYFPVPGHSVPEVAHGGKMSVLLETLQVGDTVDFKGPAGHIIYLGNGRFSISRSHISIPGAKKKSARIILCAERVSFFAAGTGITPCWQVIRTIVDEHRKADSLRMSLDPKDIDAKIPSPPRAWLLYSNRQLGDVMLKQELDDIAQQNSTTVRVTYTLTGSSPKSWNGISGRADETMCRSYLAPSSAQQREIETKDGEDEEWNIGSIMFLCGPDGMVESGIKLLDPLGFKHGQNLFVF